SAKSKSPTDGSGDRTPMSTPPPNYTPRRANWLASNGTKTAEGLDVDPEVLDEGFGFDEIEEIPWDDQPLTHSAPVVETIDPKQIAVAVDGASKTRQIRSSSEHLKTEHRVGRQVQRVLGSGWAEISAVEEISFVVR